MLLAAVLPAMTCEPKELTEDWISTLERLNTIPCRPAGRPMRSIWPSWLRWNFRCLKSRWQGPSIFIRHSRTRTAETVWEMMVASATPATPMWNTMTKNRFKKTLMTPARVKK